MDFISLDPCELVEYMHLKVTVLSLTMRDDHKLLVQML